ncbi:hypothetical protein [uncultured Alcanivorax sp.]|uniref:hypothetical protein n=1 Tax=uncultured Alcanivorax sp. TaxID=191215 RepID=UPI00260F6912|nr:hypothetical protein [uncultured Alcanivorax sp.]
MLHLLRILLMSSLLVTLAACGGGGSGSNPTNDNGNTNEETGNTGDEDGGDTDGGDTGGEDGGGDDETPPLTDEEKQQLLTLIDTNNHFTASVCPQALLGTQLGGVIDVLACENEALTNISLGNDNVLGLLCADTVAATDTDLLGSVTEPTFLPTCLEESVPYLVDTLGGILDNSGAIGQQLCPSSENPVQCLLETLNTVPDSTLAGVLGYLGCDDALNPQVCLTQVADNLAMGEPLIGTVNSLSLALCPIATKADEFAPDQCFTEVLGGVGSILNLTGGLGELCPEGADPFTCLLAAGENLGPIGELLGESPLDPSILEDLLAGLAEPGNMELLSELPAMLEQIPVLGEQLAGLLGNGGDLFGTLGDLQSLPDLLTQIPVLGDILNGAAGGDSGGLPTDALSLETLMGALEGEQLAMVTDLLANVPVLGDVVNQLLGAVSCDAANPLDCLTDSAGQLEQFTGLLEQIPVLGDVLNGLLAALTGAGTGGELLPGTEMLNEIPVLGDLLNQILTTLQGGAGGDILTPDLAMLEQIPVLGDLLSSLLGGLLSGDPSGLLDGIMDQDGNLLDTVSALVEELPLVGDLVGNLLVSLLGEGEAGNLLAPLNDALTTIPVLGPVLGGLLGLLG